MMVFRRIYFCCLLIWLTVSSPILASEKKIAVTVFPQNTLAKSQLRTAQARVETILLDNGYFVVDQKEAERLKNSWQELEDPGYLITAEDFVERAGKFNIDQLLRVYLTVDQTKTLGGYYSATASVDIRIIASDAAVKSFSTKPMGTPGVPPSDGLTVASAMHNAVQRAIDNSTTNIGLEILSVTAPQAITYALNESEAPENWDESAVSWQDEFQDLNPYPLKLIDEGWKYEQLTCQSRDPANIFLVAGGYIKETHHGKRNYSSLLHIVDIGANKEITAFNPGDEQKFESTRKLGTTKLLACFFLSSWRYVAALTGDYLILYDTERGLEMSAQRLPKGIKKGKLGIYNDNAGATYLIVKAGKPWLYKISKK